MTKENNQKTQKHYTDIKINSLPEREVEILGSLTAEKMSLMRAKALKKLSANVEIQGFRKGNAPENLIAQKVGEVALLEEVEILPLEFVDELFGTRELAEAALEGGRCLHRPRIYTKRKLSGIALRGLIC